MRPSNESSDCIGSGAECVDQWVVGVSDKRGLGTAKERGRECKGMLVVGESNTRRIPAVEASRDGTNSNPRFMMSF
jgi:hypothetical protein